MALMELRDRLSPFRLFDEIRRDMESLEERFFADSPLLGNGNGRGREASTALRPVFQSMGGTDVYEHNGNLMYETELPGVQKSDISVQVQDNRLIITGEVKRNEEINQEEYYRMGRRYGRFQRTFLLPEQAVGDVNKISARFEDGILKISVPLEQSLKGPEPIEISVQ